MSALRVGSTSSPDALGMVISNWCGGCSTGEEPHTLAMYLLEEKEKLLAGWTFDILAPDLNDDSLEAARAGSYGEFSAQYQRRAAPEILLKMLATRNFRPTICSKAQIRFDRINLSDDSKMVFQKGIDVVFCRDVLFYFDLASFYSNLVARWLPFSGTCRISVPGGRCVSAGSSPRDDGVLETDSRSGRRKQKMNAILLSQLQTQIKKLDSISTAPDHGGRSRQ
jgi:hypothetical protein